MKMTLFSFLLVFSTVAAQAKVVTCQDPSAPGIPVVQLKIVNSSVLEAREILQSNLTGILSTGKKLPKIAEDKNSASFNLGSQYTVDYTLVVESNPLKVSIESLDRDDWTGTSTELVNCQ